MQDKELRVFAKVGDLFQETVAIVGTICAEAELVPQALLETKSLLLAPQKRTSHNFLFESLFTLMDFLLLDLALFI